ncbi:hypothetical protein VPNG_03514 [Cytospora leucostoma]|uniref:DUF6546 domain-containing protein n=1 Tax=Cytospora leucostoma TaxID=1230097 RepID=A0A423XCT8_9PEZI|nr:hypothetical protein VPNG_03514 [Cytospora leucostoma]
MSLARYSHVSRQWQSLVEPLMFKSLILHQSDIQGFSKIVKGSRMFHLQYIWLRLELPTYDCESCQTEESKEEIRSHNLIYTNAIWDLFEILSSPSWTSTHGLTLELSAHSPSDTVHFGKDLKMRISDTPWVKWSSGPDRPPTFTHNDPFHGWLNGRFCRRPLPTGAKARLFGHPRGLGLDPDAPSARRTGHKLPEVSSIHTVVIRRQFYRAFSASRGLVQMFRSLPRLENFTYEPWRGPPRAVPRGPDGAPAVQNTPDEPHAERAYRERARFLRDNDHEHLFGRVLGGGGSGGGAGSGLKRMSIFEDVDDVFYETSRRARRAPKFYHPSGAVARHLAGASRDLEELHAAQNVDAEDFFTPAPDFGREPGAFAGWKNLKYLSLTCMHIVGSVLMEESNDTVINLAAKRAELMPRLEVMELWGRWATGTASIFRFERRGRRPRIQLLSTECSHVSKEETDCWQGVVDRLYPELGIRLEVEVIRLDGVTILGLASVIELLVLKDRILHPVSLLQLHQEDRRRQVTYREWG